MSDTEQNKALVRAYVEAFNAGDLMRLRDLHTHDAVIHGVLGWASIEAALPIWGELHAAYAIELAIEDIVAEEEHVAVRFTERGLSRAPFRDRPATGKTYELTAMEWYEIRGGLIHRRWGARDAASQARQLEMDA